MAGAIRRAAFVEESAEIQASMNRLETSGKTVQDAIGPIYGNTQKLQTTSNNVDRIIAAIERIREPLDMRNREERILRSSPQQVGLPEYIASIDRTNQALRDLKHSNMRSNQQAISELNALLRVGSQQLEDVFRQLLRQHNQPRTSELRTINAHVASSAAEMGQVDAKGTPTAKIYGETRGQYLTLSLQNLAAACLATAKKQNSDALYKRGDNAIGHYAKGIQGMFIAEYDSICPVFSREEWGQVLSITCQPSLDAFSTTLRDLDKHIKEHLSSDCFLAYEIIEVVTDTSLEVENRTGSSNTRFPMLSNPSARRQSPHSDDRIPPLANLHHAFPGRRRLVFSLPATAAAAAASTNSVPTLKSFDVGADGAQLFGHYATDTIEALLSNLESRSRALIKTKSAQGVFMANNIAVVDRMIRASALAPLLSAAAPKEPSAILFDVQFTNRGPRPPSGGAIDSAAILKSLSSKDKDAVKEKFRSFNASFDDLVARHKSYRMEKEVRQGLAKEVQMLIEALYARFWDRYHEVDKGKGKYVKYDKTQLGAVLASLG
ncbi:exocyst complex component exo70 [Taxawa tesnikishii (nom. ined.)]|nr:exocyst complex component exo70 [Dothideales sp. JES 119]